MILEKIEKGIIKFGVHMSKKYQLQILIPDQNVFFFPLFMNFPVCCVNFHVCFV
jgi:hypothetical protein